MNEPAIADIDPAAAHALLRGRPDAVLLDVRSRVEFDYVGHPVGAIHVAWKEFPTWAVSPDFVAQVRRAVSQARGGAAEQVPILALCRSGARSRAAAEELARHGFRELYNVAEGFEGDKDAAGHRNTVNGWRARGLPWEQT
ncbi:MAG: rhodanese-like domain-containing protein [Gammaproteobacteria bacterium]